jgi:hypothetical protein
MSRIYDDKSGTWTGSLFLWISAIGGVSRQPRATTCHAKEFGPQINRPRIFTLPYLFFSMTDHFAFDRSRIDSRKAFFHRWRE